ncbi:pantothenate synthetase [Desulfocapsa sulfexigens DSM 10523]|uniref:Pantothenate synthetase n=1 Tax=Desulfocapsa sulfexigens (strain DSM 10523 / SB164P1) TaxID=1167006 RepID=M1P7M8_DESSD|nr:pantoate--beta-alanine ligase [Desulfocapsa sulfexigens]AGF79463.1 pantothenate synthetase [Desulfocapsa sulfexigens DSM 10523]
MKVVTSPEEIQILAQQYRSQGLLIGLVPTMGWFHEGHLSLMRRARQSVDRVIVSLFINPMQFGPGEDLDNYPYDLKRDCRLAEEVGVDIIFAPDKGSMYPEGFATTVSVSGLTSSLCGASRPGHFDGVTTVVAKLFNLTLPHLAVFGEKDFQQLAVIRRMVADLDFPIDIIGHPIVREKNGLAMSSRNTYLQKDEIPAALSLSLSITAVKNAIKNNSGQTITPADLKDIACQIVTEHPECEIDYIEIVDKTTLQVCTHLSEQSLLVMAVKINKRIRLIDNSLLMES